MPDLFDKINDILLTYYADLVLNTFFINNKFRIVLKDNSFIDVNFTFKMLNGFSYHWECNNGKIFRYDNFPDRKFKAFQKYPYHFHNGDEKNVIETSFSLDINQGFKDFMGFVREIIEK